jgi:hypothetical protein
MGTNVAVRGYCLELEARMAKKAKSGRGRKQDRARIAGGQDHEVGYVAKKTGTSKSAVKEAVKEAGPLRKRVSKAIYRLRKGLSRY